MHRDVTTRRVLFVADDFGMSEAINDAIIRAHQEGALHLACLMMGQPGTEHAVELARANPGLQIGWHLHLCDSRPTTVAAWPWGESPASAGLQIAMLPSARALAHAEIGMQWQMLRSTGLSISSANAHHHLHWHPFVSRALTQLLAEDADFDGWLRWGRLRFFSAAHAPFGYALVNRGLIEPKRSKLAVRKSDTLWGIDRTFRMNADEVSTTVQTLPDGIHEFMFHPRPGADDRDTQCLIQLRDVDIGDT